MYFESIAAVANRSTLSAMLTLLFVKSKLLFFVLTQPSSVPKKTGSCLCFFFFSSLPPVLSLCQTIFLLLNSFRPLLRYFSLNESSGELTLRLDTPPGSYWLRVGVSDGVWPDVISGVRVHIRDLEEKAILSSASLRLTGNV